MDPEMENDNEIVPETTMSTWNRTYEDHILDDFTAEREDLEQQTKLEQEATAQKLWLSFQNSATAVANLYKDAAEIQRRNFEAGVQIGCNRRVKDILTWAKKRRKIIRRDELIAYLCGKPLPAKSQRHSPPRSRVGSRSMSDKNQPVSSVPLSQDRDAEPDLTAFQNALAIQGLDGAMSNVSMGYTPSSRSRADEINSLIMDGLRHHNESRKRGNSSLDLASSDSPNRKRYRFL